MKDLTLTRKRGLYLLEGKIQDARVANSEKELEIMVMPVEEIETETLKEDAMRKIAPEPTEVTLPKLPEAEAVRRHEMTHATAESWCPTCVKARGRDAGHREQDEEEKHTVAIDE